MTVITISEESHGHIGIVASKELVIPWLIENNWLNDRTDLFYDYDTHDYITIIDKLGAHWKSELRKMTWDELCDFFEDTFLFYEEEVWEG